MVEYGSMDSNPSTSRSEFSSDIESNGKRSPKRRRHPTKREFVLVGLIAVTGFTEKIIYYGIVANLVLYCTNYLDYSSPEAAIFSLVFTGANYILAFFGGWIADACLGNYNAIFVGLLMSLVGKNPNRLKVNELLVKYFP